MEFSAANVRLNKNDSKKALKHLFEIVKAGRADGQVWKSIASCHLNNGSFLSAETALENARVFAPDDSSLDEIFLNIYIQQENYSKVLPLARELSKKFPNEKKYWLTIISTLQSQDKPDMDAINKQIEDIASIKTRIAKREAKAHQDVRALLTDDQKVRFDMQRERRRERAHHKAHH